MYTELLTDELSLELWFYTLLLPNSFYLFQCMHTLTLSVSAIHNITNSRHKTVSMSLYVPMHIIIIDPGNSLKDIIGKKAKRILI